MDILEISAQRQFDAYRILEENRVIPMWENRGAHVHIVGSLKTGLLMHRDIDLHIYTDQVLYADSFSVMEKLAGLMPLKKITCKNLLDTEEECIEWHALYEDRAGINWKFDMIHIRKGSKYDGVVEEVTDEILRKLTPALRRTILQIKFDMPEHDLIPGIEVYHSVFTGKVSSYRELVEWRKRNPLVDSLSWRP